MTGPSTVAKAGLAICALLGVLDIVGLAGIGADDGPPVGVVLLAALLGLITLWGVSIAWREGDLGSAQGRDHRHRRQGDLGADGASGVLRRRRSRLGRSRGRGSGWC